ncbi:hypothetical protein HPQ64_14395 [Rhizobiales bacterium]|uniref:hypothetical protein n=1 Tax=Hongsoonwoonella zoysiae TaxID=2821844 RepID=UPI001560793F|nr:hypothetical protein [Hongsoonwoonella zoysiae]NRG18879.1 hypothetical protein [Hongsoonwoonella zoysiae]
MALALFPASTLKSWAGENIDCTCRYRGADYQLGDVVCLSGPNGPWLAQCQIVLNNTSWQRIETQCPITSLDVPDLNDTPNPAQNTTRPNASKG